ncbi:integrase [Clostridioides difficile]|uniref:phage integrase n=2 Tax=Clostridioides difficile TaxID=1496 RepID=UPI00038D54E5|nr:phage integrase [Clostridioides difficile]EGT4053527.1 integrase [Clostridioides difficile]EGT5445731.1 integrase [Clostridioides difficile]EII6836425.1 integrase [Clostridioides difficile]EIJ0742309.1 integrase [Clostridioides difficile]EKG0799607.1 integrase [Clostridioides difficile]
MFKFYNNATLMFLSETNIKTISERLGHADIKITMNRYSQFLEEMDREAFENLSKILFIVF